MNYSSMRARSSPEWDMILSAAQKNNVDAIRRLLNEEEVPPSHGNMVGQTALHIAALWGSVESMELLINAGANVDAQNQIAQMTPLHCAIRGTFQSFKQTHERRVQCVRLLLQAGADCSLCDMKGKDAFGCIDAALRESNMRKMGPVNIEEEMKEMREVLRSAGVNVSELGRCIDAMDVEGVKRCLGGGVGEEGDGAVSHMEVEKSLLVASEKFRALVDEDGAKGGECESLRRIMVSRSIAAECSNEEYHRSRPRCPIQKTSAGGRGGR